MIISIFNTILIADIAIKEYPTLYYSKGSGVKSVRRNSKYPIIIIVISLNSSIKLLNLFSYGLKTPKYIDTNKLYKSRD
jgi:hypothetical protein